MRRETEGGEGDKNKKSMEERVRGHHLLRWRKEEGSYSHGFSSAQIQSLAALCETVFPPLSTDSIPNQKKPALSSYYKASGSQHPIPDEVRKSTKKCFWVFVLGSYLIQSHFLSSNLFLVINILRNKLFLGLLQTFSICLLFLALSSLFMEHEKNYGNQQLFPLLILVTGSRADSQEESTGSSVFGQPGIEGFVI